VLVFACLSRLPTKKYSHNVGLLFQKKITLPEGPYLKSTLRELLDENVRSDIITRDEVLEYLSKACVGNESKDEHLPELLTPQEITAPVALSEPTNPDFDMLDLNRMYHEDNNDFENVDTTVLTESDSEVPTNVVQTNILDDNQDPKDTQEETIVLQDPKPAKRKECECNHEDYFGQAYSDLESKAYFLPNYMSEREHPVHFCTGLKEDGEKCGYDFTRTDLVINTTYPVRACKQALKIDTECVHALCFGCFTSSRAKLTKAGAGQRPTRRRRNNPVDENEAKFASL
jgi:hypothetical protein